jgi:Protein of unknown function (DUF1566)/Bacterial Ig-like domain (group 2)
MKSQRVERIRIFENCRVAILTTTLSILTACGGGGGGGAANSAPPTLVSIAVAPADPSVRFAQTQQLTANGNYSDGSTQDLTSSVVWNSSDTNVAGVTNGGATPGLATGVKVGDTSVTATFGGLSDTETLSVIGTVSLPKTGQVTCYEPNPSGTTTNIVPCAGTGQDGDLLAGVDWPQDRFIPGNGAAADCVTDTLTGLMWTKDGNLPATTHPGPLNGKRTWQTALNYPQSLNAHNYCGFSDWRLPNILELESLVDGEAVNQADNLNAQGFVNVQGSGAHDASGYWSATTISVIPDKAYGVDMHQGCVGSCHVKTDAAVYVWPVRGPLATATAAAVDLPRSGQALCYDELGTELTSCTGTGQDGEVQAGVAWPGSRFTTDPSGQCITDNLTGLMWAQNADAPGRQTLDEALAYVTNPLCNFSDWRLPNRKEMFSLMLNGGTGTQLSSQWLESNGFGNVGAARCFWTSTNVYNGGMGWGAAWYVHPDYSEVEARNKLPTPDCSTWPVRGGR